MSTTQPNAQVNQNQSATIEQIRKQGLDAGTLQKIQQDKAEMDRLEKIQSERIKGNYISLKDDKEQKALLFTGKYEKADVPAKDFATGQIIPDKFTARWKFQVYDVTDPNNVSAESIFEKGYRDAKTILHFLGQGKTELVIVRNGARGNSQTTYLIYPR